MEHFLSIFYSGSQHDYLSLGLSTEIPNYELLRRSLYNLDIEHSQAFLPSSLTHKPESVTRITEGETSVLSLPRSRWSNVFFARQSCTQFDLPS